MQLTFFFKHMTRCLAVAFFIFSGLAFAQSEPTLTEIYATAQSGKLDQAQVMIQQVLISHPNSAKAHYVAAELFARQGKSQRSAEALAEAEKLAPGLLFAKPESVQQLRSQIAAGRNASSQAVSKTPSPAASMPAVASGGSSSSWAVPLLLAAGVIGMGYFMFRKKSPVGLSNQTPLAGATIGSGLNNNGLNGPQAFGNAYNPTPAMQGGYPQPGYGQPGYGQPGYNQPAGTGIGGRVMGGLATGLAVGAGVMAAQAIGKTLMGDHENANKVSDGLNPNFDPLPGNADMGGENFGIADSGSWDDAGGVSDGGSWDN